jgi:hypothetical protein
MRRIALVAVGIALMLGAMTIDGMAGVFIPMPWLCDPFPKLCEGANTARTDTASPPQAEQSAGTPETKQEPAARPPSRNKKSTGTTGAKKKDAPAQHSPQLSAPLQRDFEEFLIERARRRGGDRSTVQLEDKDALFREFVQWQKDRPSSRSR